MAAPLGAGGGQIPRADQSAPSSMGMISADSHINEPRDLWRENLSPSLRSQAMQGIRSGRDGGWDLLLESEKLDQTSTYEADRMQQSDPDHRLAIMREEGIVGECIFPTVGLYVWMLTDPDGGAESCRIYNEWIDDALARHSDRFRCAGIIPTWRVEDAIAEVERVAEAGLAAIMLPVAADPEWNHPDWAPLWATIAATGLPVVMHQGTGHSMLFYRGPGAGVSNLLATQTMAPRTAALLVNAGILARHPDLHVVFVEFNVGWLAWTMQTIDYYTDAFAAYGTTPSGRKWIDPELPEPPSSYLRRQVHATFQDDPVAIHNLPLTGTDAVLWGADYPHEEGTYPHSAATVDRLAAGLSPPDAQAVFRDNAARLFAFSDEVLRSPI